MMHHGDLPANRYSSQDFSAPGQPGGGQQRGVLDPNGLQNGPGVPAHLRGTRPLSLGRRVLLHLANGLALSVIAVVLTLFLKLLGVPIMQGDDYSPQVYWGLNIISWFFLIFYACTGWMLPFGPILKVRQVKVERLGVPGLAGIGKYLLESILLILLLVPWIVVVFATRNQVQRHWVDRVSGLMVLDVREHDPLRKSGDV